jgi:TonB family protein
VVAYGETLLAVSARGSNRLLSAAAFAESDVPLRKRILAMTTPPRAASAVGVLITAAVGSILVSSAIAVPVPAVQVPPVPAVVVPGPTVDAPVMRGVGEVAKFSAGRSTRQPVTDPVTAGPAARLPGQVEESQQTLPGPRVITDPHLDPRVIIDPRLESIHGGSFTVLRSASVVQQSPTFPDPRVIADPRLDWLMVYQLSDLRAAGGRFPEPVGRLPLNGEPDSLTAIAKTMYGDSIATVPYFRSWPGNAPPETTIAPRVRNPEEVMRSIAAAYPDNLRDRGIGGTVGMHFLLGATGQVEAIRIGQISAYPALDEAALHVANVYRFSPAMQGRDAIPVWVSHAISFYPPN